MTHLGKSARHHATRCREIALYDAQSNSLREYTNVTYQDVELFREGDLIPIAGTPAGQVKRVDVWRQRWRGRDFGIAGIDIAESHEEAGTEVVEVAPKSLFQLPVA